MKRTKKVGLCTYIRMRVRMLSCYSEFQTYVCTWTGIILHKLANKYAINNNNVSYQVSEGNFNNKLKFFKNKHLVIFNSPTSTCFIMSWAFYQSSFHRHTFSGFNIIKISCYNYSSTSES